MGQGSPLLEQAGGDPLGTMDFQEGGMTLHSFCGEGALSLASGRPQAQEVYKIKQELKRSGFSG